MSNYYDDQRESDLYYHKDGQLVVVETNPCRVVENFEPINKSQLISDPNLSWYFKPEVGSESSRPERKATPEESPPELWDEVKLITYEAGQPGSILEHELGSLKCSPFVPMTIEEFANLEYRSEWVKTKQPSDPNQVNPYFDMGVELDVKEIREKLDLSPPGDGKEKQETWRDRPSLL